MERIERNVEAADLEMEKLIVELKSLRGSGKEDLRRVQATARRVVEQVNSLVIDAVVNRIPILGSDDPDYKSKYSKGDRGTVLE